MNPQINLLIKTCRLCGSTKPIIDFCKTPLNKDGRCNRCKICSRIYSKKYRAANLDKLQKADRIRSRTEERRRRNRESLRERGKVYQYRSNEWKIRNREKVRARGKVKEAIKQGLLKRQPCEACGHIGRNHAHHDDYGKPLDVRWLCPVHHGEIHRRYNDEGEPL